MRLLKRVGFGVAALAVATLMPARTEAATLAFTEVFGGTETFYTLVVEEGCTVDCEVKLTIEYSDPSAYDGKFLEAVQFDVNGADPSNVDLTSTTADSDTNWTVFEDTGVNASGCGAGGNNHVCTEYDIAPGFQVSAGGTYEWVWEVDWDSALALPLSGNIRAAYNNLDGSNFNIFSPGGGGFGGDGGGGGGIVVPEPASLALLGLGLLGVASRKRRRLS